MIKDGEDRCKAAKHREREGGGEHQQPPLCAGRCVLRRCGGGVQQRSPKEREVHSIDTEARTHIRTRVCVYTCVDLHSK